MRVLAIEDQPVSTAQLRAIRRSLGHVVELATDGASAWERLAAGVDDFLAQPVDPDELGMRLHVAGRIIGYAAQVKHLESFLPICGCCKNVRTDTDYRQEIETCLAQRQGTQITHGICPHCYESRVWPQLEKLERDLAKQKGAGGA